MSGIQQINIKNSVSIQNIKNLLGYAVKQRRGYYNQLYRVDERMGETIEKFKSVGFINTGHTLRSEIYSITDLGDQYYMDLFGRYDYWRKRLAGIFERFVKRHI